MTLPGSPDLGEPTPNAVGRAANVSHDGVVVELERSSARRLIWYGEDFLDERLPAGTRVVYANPTVPGLEDRAGAIRYALAHPEGADPLDAKLRPGMKVTIAIDDVSLPLPHMRAPDMRQSVLEVVLPLLASKGIDDVHIIVATSFHRRPTDRELRHMVGRAIFNEFAPERLYSHDGEAPNGMVELGITAHGEHARINRRAAESDLLIYININLVPMDGGHKSVGVGLCDYATLQAHHSPQAILASDSYMDPSRSELSHSAERIGEIINRHLDVFHIETALNNAAFLPAASFLVKDEDRWSRADWLSLRATQAAARTLPRKLVRAAFHAAPAPYEVIAVHAGATDPVHKKTLAYCFAQYSVPLDGQSDVVIYGIPYLSPYNVNAALNPLLVQVMALGYWHNMYRGMPVLKKGGVCIVAHPLDDEFDARFHPSYIEFFRRILPETRDSHELQRRYEAEFAHDPDYIRMYRQGHAYHPVHPFYMWYWGENGRAHSGKVIVAGCRNPEVARTLGWDPAETVEEALAMAASYLGRSPSVTYMHLPPIGIADVSGVSEEIARAG